MAEIDTNDDPSNAVLALVLTGIMGSLGALAASTLHSLLGRPGYPVGILIGYIPVYFFILTLLQIEDGAKERFGKTAGTIIDLSSIIGSIAITILSTVFIPWTIFDDALPKGRATLATGIGLVIIVALVITISRAINGMDPVGNLPLSFVLATVLTIGGALLTTQNRTFGVPVTIAGLTLIALRYVSRKRKSEAEPSDDD